MEASQTGVHRAIRSLETVEITGERGQVNH